MLHKDGLSVISTLASHKHFITTCILGLLTFSYIFTLSNITYIILGASILYVIYGYRKDANIRQLTTHIWRHCHIFFLLMIVTGVAWAAGTAYMGGSIKLVSQRMEWMIYPLFLGCFWSCLCPNAASTIKKVAAGSLLFIFGNIIYQAEVLHISRPFEWLSRDYCNTIAGIIGFLLFAFVTTDWNTNKRYKALTGFLFVGALATLAVLQTRGALLGVAVAFGAVIIYGLACYIRKSALLVSKFVYVLLVCGMLGAGGLVMQSHSVVERTMSSVVAFQQIYIQGVAVDSQNAKVAIKGGGDRVFLWRSAIDMVQDYPAVGVGTSRFNDVYAKGYMLPQAREHNLKSPHNIFLHILVENGCIGYIPYVCLLGYLIAYLIRSMKNGNGQAAAVLFGFLVVLTQGMVDWPFLQRELSQLVWFWVSFVVAENIKRFQNKGD